MTPSEMIDRLGGPTAVAKMLNVKPPSVHAWRSGGIPDDKLIRLAPILERITGGEVSRRTLRPYDWQSIWPELAVEAAQRRATDPVPASGHAGRQPPSPTNILDTVPTHSVVLPTIPPSLDQKEKP